MSINADGLKILEYIRDGRNTSACFTDNLNVPAPIANRIAEQLEQDGYVGRVSYYGIDRFSWLLTDKGADELPPIPVNEARLLSEDGINIHQLKILTYVEKHPRSLVGTICSKMALDPQEMVSNLSTLIDKYYLKDIGQVRRRLSITDSGQRIVEKYANTFEF